MSVPFVLHRSYRVAGGARLGGVVPRHRRAAAQPVRTPAAKPSPLPSASASPWSPRENSRDGVAMGILAALLAGLLATGAAEFGAVETGSATTVAPVAPAQDATVAAADPRLRDYAVFIEVDANGYPVYRLPAIAIDGAPFVELH